MPSANLAVTHVAAAQNQKEVTINDAVDALDDATNRALSLAMADADLTLTAAQANRHGLVVLTGTLTAVRTVTLPANHRRLAIRNATTGDQELRVKHAGVGAEVVVLPGATVLVQGDGTDVFGIGAAEQSLDHTIFKAGQPVADEVLMRVPVARRTRFAVDLAGSRAIAAQPATAQADFPIQRNGTSFATLRFAAGADTATFIAASATILKPGDVLAVMAPSTPDAALANVGVTLAGTLLP